MQGGEVAAMAVIEAVVRLLPGVLGNADSPREESFAAGLLEYPQYTRPRDFRGREVPEILVSGHHEAIRRWRRKEALRRTLHLRPDLLASLAPTAEDRDLLDELDDESPSAPNPESRVPKPACPIHVVLIHHPIKSRTGEIIATSVTNLDIHDIARASRTYGVAAYHLVTPIVLQRELVQGVASHWLEGESGARVPERAAALALVRVAESLTAALAAIRAETGKEPLVVMTTANARDRGTVSYDDLRVRLATEERPVALCFGTGWGLADEVLDRADLLLAPLQAASDYNHLSVRVAVGVALDRLLGDR
jgi:tRNA (guanine37-N1)-methyltransferase